MWRRRVEFTFEIGAPNRFTRNMRIGGSRMSRDRSAGGHDRWGRRSQGYESGVDWLRAIEVADHLGPQNDQGLDLTRSQQNSVSGLHVDRKFRPFCGRLLPSVSLRVSEWLRFSRKQGFLFLQDVPFGLVSTVSTTAAFAILRREFLMSVRPAIAVPLRRPH